MSIREKIEAKFRPVKTPAKEAAVVGVSAEIVAAIAGAVAMMCGDSAVITGIRPAAKREVSRGRSAWSMAGALDNTRAF